MKKRQVFMSGMAVVVMIAWMCQLVEADLFRERIRERVKERMQQRKEALRGKLPGKKPPAYDGPIYSINVDGVTRQYIMHIPSGIENKESVMPVVLFFHGGKSYAEGMDKLSGFNQEADQNNFIVVYPEGIDQRWNDGRGSELASADDVGFVAALIEELHQKFGDIRVFATGISNGAIFLHHLVCNFPDKIEAIAPVAGGMSENTSHNCHAQGEMPVMMFHGTKDPLVPWGGDTGNKRGQIGGKILSVDETIDFWTAYNHITVSPEENDLPDTVDDGTKVVQFSYEDSGQKEKVILYKIINGGHTWPGGWQYAPVKIIGRTTHDIDATQLIWEFFKRRL